jgi:hypothetical protein
MTPLGSVQFRGQFLDYAWVLLLLSLSYLVLQLASSNADGLGIPTNVLPRMQMIQKLIPLILLGFFVWAGADFGLGLRFGRAYSLFGFEDSGATFHAALDFGYWLGLLGCGALAFATAKMSFTARKFAAAALVIVGFALIAAFAKNWPSKVGTPRSESASNSLPSPISGAAGKGGPIFDASPYVAVESVSGRLLPKDTQENRFSDSLDIQLGFKNQTDKTITGLRGHVEVLDAFGNAAYEFNFRNDDKIAPKSSGGGGSYSFEHNQFENDDPYSKMVNLVQEDTAKYRVTIKRLAFSDGTILPNNGSE